MFLLLLKLATSLKLTQSLAIPLFLSQNLSPLGASRTETLLARIGGGQIFNKSNKKTWSSTCIFILAYLLGSLRVWIRSLLLLRADVLAKYERERDVLCEPGDAGADVQPPGQPDERRYLPDSSPVGCL